MSFPAMLPAKAMSDPITRLIADFVAKHIQTPNVEIEGKLGSICMPPTQNSNVKNRMDLGAANPVVMKTPDEGGYKYIFDSGIQKAQFEALKARADAQFQEMCKRGDNQMTKHKTRDTDKFFPLGRGDGKVRQRINRDTGESRCVRKNKLASIELLMPSVSSPDTPGRCLDIRISASVEEPDPVIPGGIPVEIREKTRISYKYQIWQLDLTEVKHYENISPSTGEPLDVANPTITYEAELELRKTEYAQSEHRKFSTKQDNCFTAICKGLFDNCLNISRFAVPANPFTPSNHPEKFSSAGPPSTASRTASQSGSSSASTPAPSRKRSAPSVEDFKLPIEVAAPTSPSFNPAAFSAAMAALPRLELSNGPASSAASASDGQPSLKHQKTGPRPE